MLNVLIVDDEPLARENLRTLLKDNKQITIIAESSNAIDAIGAIHRLHPDVVFLDIQMPRINGLEMISMLDPERIPYIVFVTAYDEYAIKAFEEHAFDYLLKPIEHNRLNKTLQRLLTARKTQNLALFTQQELHLKYIPCSGHNRIYLLNTNEILFASSRLNGIYITRLDGHEFFTELTLKLLETRTSLVRCHRQHLIDMNQLKEIYFDEKGQANAIFNHKKVVPISRRYLKSIKEKLGLKK